MPVLRWVFTRNLAAVTCELDSNAGGGYDVCVLPHWNVSAGAIERFPTVTAAIERHASVAQELRAAGWHLAQHVPIRRTGAMAA